MIRVNSLAAVLVYLSLQFAIAEFTVSGVSSGGFMAVQMHVAYSSEVTGAGVIAGGPYFCAQNSEDEALTACMSTPSALTTNTLIEYTNEMSANGSIDSVSNLVGSKAWVFSSLQDTVVRQGVATALVDFYNNFDVDVTTEFNVESEHAWVTNNYGNTCQVLKSPFINNCNYDSAGALLLNIYGTLNAAGTQISANLKTFDQRAYGSSSTGLASQGYMYVPTSCKADPSACKVHVTFHGCKMNSAAIGTDFVQHSGLNEWAETNEIIILYPQTENSKTTNPKGCWDWWGYTGSNYALKAGVQMAAVYKIATQLPISQSSSIFLLAFISLV